MGIVFINYRRDQTAGEARALYNDLVKLIGEERVFMDVDNIALGRDFREVLRERLADCEVMLALIGRGWADARDAGGQRRLEQAGDFVRLEIATALERNVAVTPVLLQDAHMPDAAALPEDLKGLAFRNGFSVSHSTWESNVNEMVRRLGLARGAARSKTPWVAAAAAVVAVGAVGGWLALRSGEEPAQGEVHAQAPAPAAAPVPAPAVAAVAAPAASAIPVAVTAAAPAVPQAAPSRAEIDALVAAMNDDDAAKRAAATQTLIDRYGRSADAVHAVAGQLAPGVFNRLPNARVQLLRFLNASAPSAWSAAQTREVAEAVQRLQQAIDEGRWKPNAQGRAEFEKLGRRVGG